MATDSAGHIHLLAVGHLPEDFTTDKPPVLYHLVWDGSNWSAPIPVYEHTWSPEYPQLVIDRGNQLHATWFSRSYLVDEPHQIWYAHGQVDAPAEIPVVEPTATPAPTATPTPLPTPTPAPTIDPVIRQLSVPEGATETIFTDLDDVLVLVQSLLPAFLIIIVVLFGVHLWRR
jgi:hypothetical protein